MFILPRREFFCSGFDVYMSLLPGSHSVQCIYIYAVCVYIHDWLTLLYLHMYAAL